MEGLSAEDLERVKQTCKEFCGECPTYVGLGEKEFGFCVGGKSKIIREENGCLCSGCPITSELNLKGMYYCTRGKATEQTGK